MRKRQQAKRDDPGFTLIELLISISILGIVLGAISSALIVFLRNGAYTSGRDDHSGGAILLSSYLDRDLASADTVTRTAFTAATCPAGTPRTILVVSWRQHSASSASPSPAPTGSAYVSTYVITNDSASGSGRCQLERRHTVDGGTADVTVLIRNLPIAGVPTTTLTTTAATPSCPALTDTLKLTLPRYDADDVAIDPYTYVGCVKGRTR